jgi:alcohol dehydrogenase class IV
MDFEFATAARIVFGPGKWREAGALAGALGTRALIVSGAGGDLADAAIEQMRGAGLAAAVFAVEHEPSTSTVASGVAAARQAGSDLVVGIGGGSAIDAGKAIAALMTNDGEIMNYLEVIGAGRPLDRPSAPYMAIPTTAGTGSEVTRNAVLGSPDHRVKVSLRSPFMLPRVALVDPELTFSLPPALTASTGLDALTQVIEPYVCNSPNAMIDPICREGIRIASHSLLRAFENGRDAAAREGMSLVSLFGGLALANAKLGAVHGIAGPLGGLAGAPHGAVCARLLPFVMETNIRALETRAPTSPSLARYREVASLLTGNPTATAGEGVEWMHQLCQRVGVLPLSSFGLTEAELPALAAQSQKASSMRGNPLPLTDAELIHILKLAL